MSVGKIIISAYETGGSVYVHDKKGDLKEIPPPTPSKNYVSSPDLGKEKLAFKLFRS